MRYDADHKQQTRERILKAASGAIRAEGPHRIALAPVMARAGLTHGGFYAHFASKDDLVAAAIDQMFAESRARMQRATDGRAPADALARYIDLYLSAAHRDARNDGCPVPFLAGDLPRLTAQARERFAAGVAAMRAALAQRLTLIECADPDATASSALAEMVGALAIARAEPDPAASDAVLARSRTALKARLGLKQPGMES